MVYIQARVILSSFFVANSHMIHAAAIRHNGVIYTKSKPARHIDVFVMMTQEGNKVNFDKVEKGFLTDKGEFLDRRRAGAHALMCGQVERLHVGDELYSEEIWRDPI